MPCKHSFSDYIQVRNIREGRVGEMGLETVFLHLIVGPLIFTQVSYQPVTRSLRLNARGVELKGSYVDIIRKMIVSEIKQLQKPKEDDNGTPK